MLCILCTGTKITLTKNYSFMYKQVSPYIGATTVGTEGDWSPQLLRWGTNNVLVPQLLAVVLKSKKFYSK